MKIKIVFLLLISVVCIYGISAQKSNKKITITGTVVDASGNPVGNAIVMIDGKNTSSITDSKGFYQIKVKSDAERIGILTFGSGLIEESISGRTEINLKFGVSATQQKTGPEIEPGDEAVNTGYGYVKQKNVTTEASKIDGTNKKYASYSSVYEMIQREVSGVRISGTSIIINESKDFFGNIPALLVVDGTYVTDFSNISPSSVESIEVLKGTAAAIYGSRGYGGAVVIKTRLKN
jgi:TonB-dependent SusC/RagA subfamily outer membrane receptor